MLDTIKQNQAYLNYLEQHWYNVQIAWEKLKIRGRKLPLINNPARIKTLNKEILIHDRSKFTAEEFTAYRACFFPTETETQIENFKELSKSNTDKAFKHHVTFNTHHWENWTVNHKVDQYVCNIHMTVDWIAMGMKFDDNARDYYEKNKHKIKIPGWAEEHCYQIFECYYV